MTIRGRRGVSLAAAICAVSLLFLIAIPVRAETLSLDADYTGYAQLVGAHNVSVNYDAQGFDTTTASGLGFFLLATHVSVDWTDPTFRTVSDDDGQIRFESLANGHNELDGQVVSGSGAAMDYSGDFVLDHGFGAYDGFTGTGSFHVICEAPPTLWPSVAPAVISIRGSISRPTSPVPEPGSLSLIVAGVPLIGSANRVRRRQPKAARPR